jgi:hypothetical protein
MSMAALAGRIDTVEQRMDSIESQLDASFATLSTQILQSNHETRDAVLATLRSEMEILGADLRSEMATLGADLRSEMATLGADLRGEVATLGGSLRGELTDLRDEMGVLHGITIRRFEKLETTLAEGLEETRRFMRILHEDTLSRIALLREGWRPS